MCCHEKAASDVLLCEFMCVYVSVCSYTFVLILSVHWKEILFQILSPFFRPFNNFTVRQVNSNKFAFIIIFKNKENMFKKIWFKLRM